MKSGLLLSGGMDSLALAWWKRPDIAFTIDYGQLAAEAELQASAAICKRIGIEHQIIRIDCRALGSGDMAGVEASPYAPESDWWPYRNQLLITLAAMRALHMGIERLWIATVRSDNSHQDGTRDFVDQISRLMKLQEGGLVIEAPAMEMSTAGLIRCADVPDHLIAWAHSCHRANVACGQCRGCNKYFQVFRELNGDMG